MRQPAKAKTFGAHKNLRDLAKMRKIREMNWMPIRLPAIVENMGGLKHQLRRLQKLLRRRGASPQDAEDLVQEAVVRLFSYTRKAGEVRNADAFLTRTVLNLAVDLHRSTSRARIETDPVENLDLLDLGPTPEDLLAAEQRLLRMRGALDRVSRRTRDVFFMHRLQGLSHAEIAAKVGVSKSAWKSTLPAPSPYSPSSASANE